MPCLEPRGVERGRRRKIYDKATLILIHGTVSLELATGDGEKQSAREKERAERFSPASRSWQPELRLLSTQSCEETSQWGGRCCNEVGAVYLVAGVPFRGRY